MVTLLVDNPQEGPPNEMGALTWKQQNNLVNVAVFADPNYSLIAPGMSFGTPYQTVVDPKTMQVTFTQEGYNPAGFPEAEALARTNAGVGQL